MISKLNIDAESSLFAKSAQMSVFLFKNGKVFSPITNVNPTILRNRKNTNFSVILFKIPN